MKVLFDTSVLVAALGQAHPNHVRALPWLSRAKAGEIEFLVSLHSVAELYAVLSALPTRPRLSPAEAWRLVRENVEASAHLVALTPEDYISTIRRISERGLAGGVVYDALLARAAEKSAVDRLLTFNEADFLRAWPEGAAVLLTP